MLTAGIVFSLLCLAISADDFCSARVSYTKIEQQFKERKIHYTHVNPTAGSAAVQDLGHLQSSLARSVPGLCVQSSDILSGVPAAEAAMPNIRVMPLNWWTDKKAQVGRLVCIVKRRS